MLEFTFSVFDSSGVGPGALSLEDGIVVGATGGWGQVVMSHLFVFVVLKKNVKKI